MTPITIAIRPTRGSVSLQHQKCWEALEKHVSTFTLHGATDVALTRSLMVSRCLQDEPDTDVVLWIDDDMLFDPADALELAKLCREGHNIISVPYSPRCPGSPMNGIFAADGKKHFGADGQVYDAFAVCGGFTAVNMRVYKRLAEVLPECSVEHGGDRRKCWPFYGTYVGPDRGGNMTMFHEDNGFCRRAAEHGFKSYLWTVPRIGHVGDYAFTVEDCFQVTKRPERFTVDVQP